MGLVGAPLFLASAAVTLLRGNDPVVALAVVATVPIIVWELSLGVWLVVKGFKPSPITTAVFAAGTTPADRDAAH